ncbi:MAG: 16S rRNA (uracil(1498)-N(3))-methyltransferase [Bacteroidales bacterium]
MSVPFAYTDTLLAGNSASFIALDADESFHLCRVLRMRKGSTVLLTDGRGNHVDCEVVESDPKRAILQLLASPITSKGKNYFIHIALAPTKHPDRLEWFIEKATEIGVDKISLIICEHSEKWNVKTARLQRLMISAMKQSQQTRLPWLAGPLNFTELLTQKLEDEKYIGYCDTETNQLASAAGSKKSIMVAIGPEGDFSPKEIEMAMNNGFHPISLGSNRLRTETAGLVACQIIHTINELKP